MLKSILTKTAFVVGFLLVGVIGAGVVIYWKEVIGSVALIIILSLLCAPFFGLVLGLIAIVKGHTPPEPIEPPIEVGVLSVEEAKAIVKARKQKQEEEELAELLGYCYISS